MENLLPLLNKLNDVAVLLPTLGCIGLGYLHVVWRREEREDRRTLLATFDKVVEALNSVRIALAAITGKS